MTCNKCNQKISITDSTCPHCGIKILSRNYKNNPKFFVTIICSCMTICILTFLLLKINIFYITIITIISLIFIIWAAISYLTRFTLDNEGITYYRPTKDPITLKWDEIEEFTVYKENEKKKIFPRKIYTLKSIKFNKKIAFPEMKHTMEGYTRFMSTIFSKTKKYPVNRPEDEK